LDKKNPKIVAACVTIMAEGVKFVFNPFLATLLLLSQMLIVLCRGFGTQTTNPKPVLKAIPKIFGHADNAVRAEASISLTGFFFLLFHSSQHLSPSLSHTGIQACC